ncbi:MAG TPA: thiamine phosphate synthase [Pyrinomonadaceae bacterium]|nr:thiamine phosphate synthase [Pyrinomonadaceae bacterium]
MKLPRIYPITDTQISGLSHADQVRLLAEAGATFVQLREKNLPALDFFDEAKEAARVIRDAGLTLIVNDRVDIALALKTGVHLGQDDLPPDAARKLLGNQAIIGFSTHNVSQAIAAASLPVDYVAIGPIFQTGTKANPDPVVGIDGLRAVRQAIGAIPLVAIGGITVETAASVINAGADSVALISALLSGGRAGISANYRTLAQHLARHSAE